MLNFAYKFSYIMENEVFKDSYVRNSRLYRSK